MTKGIIRSITLILIIALIGTSCVFADESESKGQDRWTMTITTFDANGGYCGTGFTSNQPGTSYGTMPVPTRSGYVFTGWFPDGYGETIEVTGSSTVPSQDRTLYAHWGYPRTLHNIGADKYLNIDGSNLTSLYNGMNITVWSNSGSNEQKWLWDGCIERYYMKSYVDRNYGLNVHRSGNPYNCNIRKVIGNEADAQLYWIPVPLGGSFIGYLVKLRNYDLYLTAGGSTNGSNVYWAPRDVNNDYQLWE